MEKTTGAVLLLVSFVLVACGHKGTPEKAENRPAPAETSTGNPGAKAPEVASAPPSVTEEGTGKAVQAEIFNVRFHLTKSASALLQVVSGYLLPAAKNELVVFDDKNSFELHVANGTISMTPQALASVLNESVFAGSDSPLRDVSLSIRDGLLIIKGKLHSKGDLPFETAASLSANGDGRLRLRTEKVKALHVPVKKVMGLFGIELANLLSAGNLPGIETEGNDSLLDLRKMLPPPHIRGKATAVRLERNAIVTVFGDGGKNLQAMPEMGNYMRFEGSRVRFGRLTMENTDLTVVDMDPEDPLDWDQNHYGMQVEAGYSKLTANLGVQVFVKDYGKLGAKNVR